MRRRALSLLAAASLAALFAHGATRPRYGGTLRVEVRESLASYDPAQGSMLDAGDRLRQQLASLIFDRLVTIDDGGQPQPALATAWQHDSDFRRWVFELRPGVKLHDGNPLPARLVAASLAAANPAWRVRLQSDDVIVECEDPHPNLLLELALTRNSIVARAADGSLIGTGAFKVENWQPGRRATLAANDEHWAGRPFVDSIDLLMGRAPRDQALDLRLDRADIIELPPDQVRRATQDGERVVSSSTADLLAIVFPKDAASAQQRAREALSLAIDRAAIHTAILQRQGEPAGALLPQWVTGYAFLFPATASLAAARQQLGTASAPPIQLAVDANDATARAVAERVAVNARDLGIAMQIVPANENASPARLVRMHLPSTSAPVALGAIADALDAPAASIGSLEKSYTAERALLGEFRVLPIVYSNDAYSLGPRVHGVALGRDGSWHLDSAWLGAP